MHTVFGPVVDNLRQQNVIFTRTPASGNWPASLKTSFTSTAQKLPIPHQNITTNRWPCTRIWNILPRLSWRMVLLIHFGDPTEFYSYSSPISVHRRSLWGRILGADPDLYSEIQGTICKDQHSSRPIAKLPRHSDMPGSLARLMCLRQA